MLPCAVVPRLPRTGSPLISVVVPVLDEEGSVAELARRVREAILSTDARYEILFVDDGSRDNTLARLAELAEADPNVKWIGFTRSFGHQAALAAGLAHARGDAVVTMDGDLQHPPETLPGMIKAWREGADVVHSVRRTPGGFRRGWKERVGRLFYPLMRLLTSVPVVLAGADFRLLDRRAVDQFNALEEHFLFMRGLVPWLGFRSVQLEYDVGSRFAGHSKYRLRSMLRMALTGIFSFSVVPLRLITLVGLFTTLLGIAYGIFAVVSFFTGNLSGPRGWTSLMVVLLIFGGVQLLSIGVLSEYVGRIYEEAKRRPRYVIDSKHGVE